MDKSSNNNQGFSITAHPALNQKALESADYRSELPTDKVEYKKTALQEIMQTCREKYLVECPKYNRKQACLLISYPGKTKAFSQWLRDNRFLLPDGYPEPSLIDRGFMGVHQKNLYKLVEYDCCNIPVSGNEFEEGRIIKTIYTPLITEKGISFFKTLLTDEVKLKQEVEQIKSLNKPHTNNV